MMVHSDAKSVSIPVADMSALIALLERSEVGSYVLDEIISDALCKSKFRTCIAGLPDEQGGLWMYEFDGHDPSSALRVTQSLDAALALLGRALPDASVTINTGSGWVRLLTKDGRYDYGFFASAQASSPAVALCIAILKAKAQVEGG